MTAHVTLQNVWFHYPGSPGARFELRIESLDIQRGERIAIIGPSGSGKTTLLNLIAGIILPCAGTVLLENQPVSALSDTRRRAHRIATVGMVFQEFQLLEYLSAFDNILLPLRVARNLSVNAETRRRARSLADSLGVAHTLGRLPNRLSQGERQRIAICRSLITEPSLVMGDEPTGNLDPTTADATMDLLLSHVERHDATLLIVTHNHAILDRFDRVLDIQSLHAASAATPGRGGGGAQ